MDPAPVSELSSEQQVAILVQRLVETENSLMEILEPHADSVLHSQSGRTVLLENSRKALLESQLRYKRLVARLSAIIFELEPDGTILFVNEAVEKVTGYRPTELVGQNWWDTFFPGKQRAQVDALNEELKLGDVNDWEMVLTAKNKSQVTLEVNSANHRYVGGLPSAIIGIGVDITRRKWVERRLALNNTITKGLALSPTLAQACPIIVRTMGDNLGWSWGAIWHVDASANNLRCLETWSAPDVVVPKFDALSKRMTLESGSDLPGQVWAAKGPIWFADITKSVQILRLEAGKSEGLTSGFAVPILNGANVIGVLEFFSIDRIDLNKEVSQTVTMIGSQLGQLMELKRAQEAQARLALILETTTDFVGMVDPSFKIFYANPAGHRMLGYPVDEGIVGRALSELFPDEAGKALSKEAFLTSIRDGVWSGESTWLTKEGKKVPVLQLLIAHKTQAGDVEFFSTIARNISERIDLENELRQSHKMEAIGKLAGGIAHDFNNLLTIIMGYSQQLAENLPEEKVAEEPLREIGKASHQAAALISQLLTFSRKQVLSPVILNLNVVVGDLEKMMQLLVGESIALTVVLDPTPEIVEADQSQVEQLLMNLAANARDAMPNGGKLTVETRHVVLNNRSLAARFQIQPGNYVLLSVTDSGCGMDNDTIARAFEPFFTTKKMGSGTGLGLSTVYGIVTQSGGAIEVSSKVGIGTEFKIYLPKQEGVAITKKTGTESPTVPGGTETVLLVEDEARVRKLTETILTARGYQVITASSGDEALRICESHKLPITILITDVVMPKMGGRELAEKVKSIHPQIKVLFISGYPDDAVVRHGILQNRVFFLQKPFTPSALSRKVRNVIDSVS